MGAQEDSNTSGFVRWGYDRLIRPFLPDKIGVKNGVAVRGVTKLLDRTEEFPTYEEALIEGLRGQVGPGDGVVVVGGGFGVSTVTAARAVSPGGSVITFEGSARRAEMVRDTVSLNRMDDVVEVRHAVVGSFNGHSAEEYGNPGGAETIPPEDLPDCDVLELDCEGAELDILRGLTIRPRAIVVETHAFLGSPEEAVRSELDGLGYRVVDRDVEDDSNGVYVLVAVRDD